MIRASVPNLTNNEITFKRQSKKKWRKKLGGVKPYAKKNGTKS